MHVPSWMWFLRSAVKSGAAKLLKGELPAKIVGEPKLSYVTEPVVDPKEKLMERLIAVMYAGLSPEQRAEVADLMK